MPIRYISLIAVCKDGKLPTFYIPKEFQAAYWANSAIFASVQEEILSLVTRDIKHFPVFEPFPVKLLYDLCYLFLDLVRDRCLSSSLRFPFW